MKKYILSLASFSILYVNAQVENKITESDTTRIKLNKKEIIIVEKDTIDTSKNCEKKHDGRWDGIDFGPTILLNSSGTGSFPLSPQWENDPAKSFYWNLNFVDYRFSIYKHIIGITTGFGLNFTQIGIRNNNVLFETNDSLWIYKDTINSYKKNKLRATYLQVPLLLEFNTSSNQDKAFYFALGVIGGVRVGSALILKTEDYKSKTNGTYALNPFKLDATVRIGYNDWGLFANYALLPLFETSKTSIAYPFTFGASFNF